MNFNFQTMKPLLQADFDRVLDEGYFDCSAFAETIPVGGDAYERKAYIVEWAAEHCPVQLFGRYPFAFKLDCGEPRNICYIGVGNRCIDHSGVDFAPLHELAHQASEANLARFHNFTDPLHRTLDHDKLLGRGFRGVWEDCVRLNETEPDPEKKRYRQLVMRMCKAVEKIGLRLRALAEEELAAEQDEERRQLLTRMIQTANVPWEPAGSYFEALTSILRATHWISGLDGVEMNAYGSLDRLLYPYYRREVEQQGSLSHEEADYLLQCFLHKTDFHVHYNDERRTYDNGVSVMVGGCDLDGTVLYNPVTDMILGAYRDNALINPKFNTRACKDSPRPYLQKLADLILSGNNNIVVQNDDYIIPMFLKMGLSPEDARTYVGNGCQEVICRNQLHSRAFTYINMAQILLDTLHGCRNETWYPGGRFDISSPEKVKQSFLANLRAVIGVITGMFARYEPQLPHINPEPMMSAFTADCIDAGCDMTRGGARYNHKTLSLVGFGTVCDSLLALQEHDIPRLLAAMEKNFEGEEVLRRSLLQSGNRFGHSEKADAFAAALADDLAAVSRGIFNANGVEWRTSLFTYDTFRGFGKDCAATPDGRLAGESLSRQMTMARIPAITDAARSMNALSEAAFCDVGMFDLSLPIGNAAALKESLVDYIRTCLQLRIPVLQTNVADRRQLMEEYQKPGSHPDLVVRVCGYSAIFSGLPAATQKEIIERLEA